MSYAYLIFERYVIRVFHMTYAYASSFDIDVRCDCINAGKMTNVFYRHTTVVGATYAAVYMYA